MPRPCSVCHHEAREAIDKALLSGTPNRGIARTYALSEDAIARHRRAHLAESLAQAAQAATVAKADDLLAEVRALRSKAVSLLLKAERAGDYRTALAGIREARACVEVLLEVEGELDRRPVVNLVLSPEWLALRGAILTALRPYPEARLTVAAALNGGRDAGDTR